MKKLLIALAATIGFAIPVAAQVVQPVYTRPSKGAALVVFDSAPVGSPVLSAVYDMTAFAEAQFESAVVITGYGTKNESYNVSQLGRYIKIRAEYLNQGASGTTAIIYTVLGADTATGNFQPLPSANAIQAIRPVGTETALYTSAKLTMTPLPYTTIQYTRPGKGATLNLLSDVAWGNGATPTYSPSSPVIDLRGSASVAINIKLSSFTCKYVPRIDVWGGNTSVIAEMERLRVRNSFYIPRSRGAYYVVNTPTAYGYVQVQPVQKDGGTSSCVVSVNVTPLPYEAADSYEVGMGTSEPVLLSAGGTYSEIDVSGSTRIQNLGPGAVSCAAISSPTFAYDAVTLAAPVAPGTGGVLSFDQYAGNFYCRSLGGVASTLGVLTY